MTTFDILSTFSMSFVALSFVASFVADRVATRNQKSRKQMVFMMGNCGAGKSTVSAKLYGATHQFVDADQFKAEHPDYDPKNPHLLHRWSMERYNEKFNELCQAGAGQYVMDGTGATLQPLLDKMLVARESGFEVNVLYVQCSLETSLRRNARRERSVPEEVVIEKSSLVTRNFEVVRQYADNVVVVNNDTDTIL